MAVSASHTTLFTFWKGSTIILYQTTLVN